MSTRRPLGTGPVPAVDDAPGTPGVPGARAVLAAERLDSVATVPPMLRPAGRRPLSTGPTTTG
ncbi:hypothetical protein ACFWEB_13505 [Streptomyces parvus]|uniref:hypothetical protein n=1 Tax=Streptomyces parvus TaxID=66428 RepID=UPI00365C02EF